MSFLKVVEAINECAFKTSDLPVHLSLEMHCSLPQQAISRDLPWDIPHEIPRELCRAPAQRKIALLLRNILGSRLLLPEDVDGLVDVSPDALRGRVLVKGKLPKPKAVKGRGLSARYSAGEYDTGESFDSKSRRDLRTKSIFGPFSPFARRLTGKASRFNAHESRGSLVSVSSLGSPRDTSEVESAAVESESTLPKAPRRRSLPFNLTLPSFGGAAAEQRAGMSSPKGGRLGLREVRATAAASAAALTTATATANATVTATGAQKIAGAPRLGRGGARDGLGRDAHGLRIGLRRRRHGLG